jgi:hypothetical protein
MKQPAMPHPPIDRQLAKTTFTSRRAPNLPQAEVCHRPGHVMQKGQTRLLISDGNLEPTCVPWSTGTASRVI